MTSDIDLHVGKRLRRRRRLLGLTQQSLAEEVGIRFQQIQKYETGMNRISASRLWDIASALQVDISYFFQGLDMDALEDDLAIPGDIIAEKEALDLVRCYYSIPETQRRRLFDLARVLSAA